MNSTQGSFSKRSRNKQYLSEKDANQYSSELSCFKSTSRDKFPFWAGRFAPINNTYLQYDVCFSQIKGKEGLLRRVYSAKSNKTNYKVKRVENLQRWLVNCLPADRPTTANIDGIGIEQYKDVLGDRLQQRISSNSQPISVSNDGFFDRMNTIAYRVKTKSNLHLCFDRQVNRPVNVNKILYDYSLQYDSHKKKIAFKSTEGVHPFESYDKHDVFRPSPITDIIYDWTEAESVIRPKRCQSSINFRKMTSKIPLKVDAHEPIAYTRLDYNHTEAELKCRPTSPVFKIKKGYRKLVFTKQVILAKRGYSR